MKEVSICGWCEDPIVFNQERMQWMFAGKHKPGDMPAFYCGKSRDNKHHADPNKERQARHEG